MISKQYNGVNKMFDYEFAEQCHLFYNNGYIYTFNPAKFNGLGIRFSIYFIPKYNNYLLCIYSKLG